jgi:hypothetical protein
MSLSHIPQEDSMLLGLANSQHWLLPTTRGQVHMMGCKAGTILRLMFLLCFQW